MIESWHVDAQYKAMCEHILANGVKKNDRTGVGTTSVFGYQMRFPLDKGFPLLTTKKIYWRGVAVELLWFLRGESNIKFLQDNKVSIWNEWVNPEGELGRTYGVQWRKWRTPQVEEGNYDVEESGKITLRFKEIDQIADVINQIKTNPDSRRLIVSAWNPSDVPTVSLPPCHSFFQFYVVEGRLSCHLFQRSADAFLGVPFNIASYALLTHMVAQVTGLKVGEFLHSFTDLHIYNNHIDQVKEQLKREPKAMPNLQLNSKITDIDGFSFKDLKILNYDPHPAIKAPVAV